MASQPRDEGTIPQEGEIFCRNAVLESWAEEPSLSWDDDFHFLRFPPATKDSSLETREHSSFVILPVFLNYSKKYVFPLAITFFFSSYHAVPNALVFALSLNLSSSPYSWWRWPPKWSTKWHVLFPFFHSPLLGTWWDIHLASSGVQNPNKIVCKLPKKVFYENKFVDK